MEVEEPLPVRQAKALLQCLRPAEVESVAGRREFLTLLAGKLRGGGFVALFKGAEEDGVTYKAKFTLLALARARAGALRGLDDGQVDKHLGKLFANVKSLVGELKELSTPRFGYVRRLLTRLLKLKMPADGAPAPTFWARHAYLTQQLALSTYKDPDLPVDERLRRALDIISSLHDYGGQQPTDWHETYGITGAIYKRLWEYDSQKQNLERSLNFYLKGYAVGAPDDAAKRDVLAHLAANPETARVSTTKDNGYTGINAAFILDRLAYLEEREARATGTDSRLAAERRRAATLIRREVFRTVSDFAYRKPNDYAGEWWYYATVAEALFGLGQYTAAVGRLREGGEAVRAVKKRDVPRWEFETTARQFATLAYLKSGASSAAELEGTEAWNALADFLGAAPVRSAFTGKVGLGLSGGGFRASFYHIGVLARLAEVGLLQHVEVLSCVSGGSIVGAHYYLKLRKLLEERRDGAAGTADYVRLVEELAEEFLAGVKRNVRTRVLAHLPSNLKVLLVPGYSRTLRVGELYERELYSRVGDSRRDAEGNEGDEYFTGCRHVPDWLARLLGEKRHPRYLADLRVMPLDREGRRQTEFDPKHGNLWRENKVPVLILNAASLNTGHTWQFTTTWMGEPPAGIVSKIDGNDRLRRMYYREAPEMYDKRTKGLQPALYRAFYRLKSLTPFDDGRRPWQHVRLGHAVAASSGVPGLFEPLAMEELFPKRIVRLVDGGVCDNQGVVGLLDQECTVLLVSDGSGQSASQADPSENRLKVLIRSDNIAQSRVRESQYRELAARKRSSLLRNLLFVHLKQELEVTPTDWLYCAEPYEPSDDEPPGRPAARRLSRTGYGIDRALQERLSAVRTDLDSFHDVEAYALMLSGYRMTRRYLPRSVPEFATTKHRGRWPFKDIRTGVLDNGSERHKFTSKVVRVGGLNAFKVFLLKWWLMAAVVLAGLGLAYGVWWFFKTYSDLTLPAPAVNVGDVGTWLWGTLKTLVIGLAIVGAFRYINAPKVGAQVKALVFWSSTLRSILVGTVMSTVGWIIAWIHLGTFDQLYKSHGSIENFKKRRAGGARRPRPAPP
jgi:predicted acylesterase/phospholipase RssA